MDLKLSHNLTKVMLKFVDKLTEKSDNSYMVWGIRQRPNAMRFQTTIETN